MDNSWLQRLECERRLKNISGDKARVLVALYMLTTIGDYAPSEARLANEAGVSRSTVQRAKRAGRALGLLEWERNVDFDHGLRQEKPCSYRTEMPAAPPIRRERQKDALTGSNYKGTKKRSIEQLREAAGAPVSSTAAGQALLAAHRAKVQAELINRHANNGSKWFNAYTGFANGARR